MNKTQSEGLNTLEMIGAAALAAGILVLVAALMAPKGAAALLGGGALAAMGSRLLIAGMSAGAGAL